MSSYTSTGWFLSVAFVLIHHTTDGSQSRHNFSLHFSRFLVNL